MALLASNLVVICLFASFLFFEHPFHWLLMSPILWLLVGFVVRKKLYAFEIATAEAARMLWDELQARERARL